MASPLPNGLPLDEHGRVQLDKIPVRRGGVTIEGASIVAAGGWCAPSEIDLYGLVRPIERREPTQAEIVDDIAATIDRADRAIAEWEHWRDAATWTSEGGN